MGARVRTGAEGTTGDTVSDGAQPCQLRLVDSKVGAAGAVETLLVENPLAGRRWKRFRLDRPN